MKLSRRELLASAVALPMTAPALAAAPSARRLVVLMCTGGWDSTCCVDPKLGVAGIDGPSVDMDPNDPLDIEEVETFSGIPIATNHGRRPSVSAFFERYGAKSCAVNGIWMGAVSHAANARRLLTGTTDEGHADYATIASTVLAPDHSVGNLDLIGVSVPGPFASRLVRIGSTGQLRTLLDDDAAFTPSAFTLDHAQLTSAAAFRASRLERLRIARGGSAPNNALLDGLADAVERRPGLDAIAPSLDFARTVGLVGSYNYNLALTLDLFRRDLGRVVTLASTKGWDTHANNIDQSGNIEELFNGLLPFVDALDADGMLETTTIAIVSEMTRSPRINAAGGKDHWPVTSALLIGGGIRGGQVVGATDDRLEPLPIDGEIRDYANLMAGILTVLGVDSQDWLPGVPPLELG